MLVVLVAAAEARSAVVHYAFTGQLTVRDDNGVLEGAFANGDDFSGTLAYDLEAPADSVFARVAYYGQNPLGSSGITLSSNGYLFGSDPTGSVKAGSDGSTYPMVVAVRQGISTTYPDQVSFSTDPNSNAFGFNTFNVLLFDNSLTAFDSVGLPANLDLSDFTGAQFLLQGFGGLHIRGSLDTFVPVPEPQTALLLAIGLGIFGGMRRRSRAAPPDR